MQLGGQRYWSWIITASYNPGDRNTALSQSREQLLNHAEEERQRKEGEKRRRQAKGAHRCTFTETFINALVCLCFFNNHALLSSLPDRTMFNFSKMPNYISDSMTLSRRQKWQICTMTNSYSQRSTGNSDHSKGPKQSALIRNPQII